MKIFKTITILMAFGLLVASCKQSPRELFIEAESFQTKGGWEVDPQFVEAMGSPYLLAHGLGEPVENASTQVVFPDKGTYHAWARTKNWVPGEWEAPGKFKLVVNGSELSNTLGTQKGWNWEYAGQVSITETMATVELKDLTGFEGRCDALYFSISKEAPPHQADQLAQWRKEKLNQADAPQETHEFDLVIVGGGIAGCGAAIAAAERGLEVGLVQDRPVLGGNASKEIRVHTEGIHWHGERILSMLDTEHWPNGSPKAEADQQKRRRNMEQYENISIFLNWRAYDANVNNNSITSVDARHTSSGERKRFKAPYFADCTGDGWIGYWAGAEYMYGREPRSKYDEGWEEHGELWSPEEADNRVMGASVLWRTNKADRAIEFPEVPWAIDVAEDHAATSGTWHWEFSKNELHQVKDAETIRDHMFRAIYGSFYNAKQKPENDSVRLEWMSYLVGKRESRRLEGDYIYTFNDMKKNTKFEDAVAKGTRDVDVHYQQWLKDPSKVDFLSEALFYPVEEYYIPYRSLYSKNIENLFMAGRNFSCSHIGLGGPRVMNTTGQMGIAVGYAASLCKKYETDPRGVYEEHIDELTDIIKNQ
ncbi:MAG: FAD-dependent oxidoreductase [Bacteroidales bacterium]|nr:FAD-dependent oxidoreductase [Bacteroidales bacterium]